MRNPFAKPRTLGQWLLGSVCWTVSCVGAWALLCAITKSKWDGPTSIVAGLVVQVLLWWRAIPKGRALLEPAAYSWLVMLGWQWWLLLHMTLVISFVLTVGAAITNWLVVSWPSA
jgi:hypothetical protein